MIETAALVEAGKLQFLDRVGDLLQVLGGQVQIAGCHLQILMAEQELDGAQIGTGFQQMRGPTVSNQVRARGLAKARLAGCFGARHPYRIVAYLL